MLGSGDLLRRQEVEPGKASITLRKSLICFITLYALLRLAALPNYGRGALPLHESLICVPAMFPILSTFSLGWWYL